jgi:pSer/pThr/pTyr-binding forkhead associated (FHA) protein
MSQAYSWTHALTSVARLSSEGYARAAAVAGLVLEIVEGPGSGRQLGVDRPIVIGRASDADLVVEDAEVSRHHARVSPAADGSAVVEDLGSHNGTFVNNNQLYGTARLDRGDELMVGVTVIRARDEREAVTRGSTVRPVPAALARAPGVPNYVNPAVVIGESAPVAPSADIPSLEKYLDVRVRRRAQLAPLALFVLVALVLIIYFALR